MSLEERYREVARRVGGRALLVAVTKGQPADAVRRLYDLGQRDFGENRVDELLAKAAALPGDARWHFIGNVQRNKAKLLARASLVHSFDRPDLARAWPRVPVLLQVDFTGREDRSGLAPDALAPALEACRAAGVDVRGLSTLPPQDGEPRRWFRELRRLRDGLGLRELSMGMSADYEAALEEGATMVRVGRALFG
ncbi:MAG TPA: YggS family pyridoxal phosphate-dependent enzyme [Candidatus Thermoplasmatota archaeon]|nr:YggS family pyridoxal phosphate-dependent enzyme [Candidatus Thermoplasmatota archaeon]